MDEKEEREGNSCSGQLIGPIGLLKCVFSVAFPQGATLVGSCPHQPECTRNQPKLLIPSDFQATGRVS